MTPRIPENVVSTWLVEWGFVTIIGNRRETPTTMMTKTAKTKRTRTGTTIRRSSGTRRIAAARASTFSSRVNIAPRPRSVLRGGAGLGAGCSSLWRCGKSLIDVAEES